jgi:hypothetical protein
MAPSGTWRRSWHIFLKAGGTWLERNAFVHAGALAFYTLFSLAPVVIIAVAVAGVLFGAEAARGEVEVRLQEFIGPEAARAIGDPRPLRDRETIEFGQAQARHLERSSDDRTHDLEMAPRRQLGDDAAVRGVDVVLGGHDARQHLAAAVEHGGRRLVTGRLDTEDDHAV